MRHVLVLVAMEPEARAFVERLGGGGSREEAGLRVADGTFDGVSVTVARTGIGKVAAARACGRLLAGRRSDLVIVAGVSGALADLPVGTVVVADAAVQHDLDVRPLTDAAGVVPGLGTAAFAADAAASDALADAAPRDAVRGLVASGDAIIRSAEAHARILRDFPGALAVDMETAAIAHACRLDGVPWAAVRLISDGADEAVDADEILGVASRTSATLADLVARALG